MDYEHPVKADLHIHSTESDGTLSPDEIVSSALRGGVQVIAITDHDTISGSVQAMEAGIPPSMQFITGVEISADYPPFLPRKGSIHVLGYNVDPADERLKRNLELLQESRLNRTPRILAALNSLGVDITMEELSASFPAGQIGRPHIAQLMADKNIVGSIHEAFDVFLGNGKSAYVEKQRIPYADAVKMILDAGGVPVLAHPYLIQGGEESMIENLIKESIPLGLRGIEAFYPHHTAHQTNHCLSVADRYDLFVTGGTDFHGDITPDTQIGYAKDNFSVSVKDIEKFLNSIEPVSFPH